MTVATNGADTTSSAFDFDVVSALDGDDIVNGVHNGAILLGGLGNDTITTTYTLNGPVGSQVQVGGDGDDTMFIDHDGGNATGSVTANFLMDGGDGIDTINGEFDLTSGGNTVLRSNITGGLGDDILRADGNGQGANSAAVETVIEAGRGNDTVTFAGATSVVTTAAPSLANALLYVDLGAGSDELTNGFLQSQSSGNNNVIGTVLGGSGRDTINLNVDLASSASAAGGTTTAAILLDGGAGTDMINSVIDSDFGTQELDDVTVTLDIEGGGGNGTENVDSTVDLFGTDNIDFDATFDLGASRDTVIADHDFDSDRSTGVVNANTLFDLGTGPATLTADTDINTANVGFLVNTVNTSGGASAVDMDARTLADSFAVANNIVTTGGADDTVDLTAFAFVRSTGATVDSHVADARNTVFADNGNNTIDVSAQAQSSGDGSGGSGAVGAFALNFIEGGAVVDDVTSGTFIFSDSNGGTGEAQFFVNAESGDDVIDSTMSSDFSELFEVSFDSDIQGDGGNDTITSNIDAFARNTIEVDSVIEGGNGADVISSTIIAESFGSAAMTISETINGGGGGDTITSVFDSSQTAALTGDPSLAINGGGGNDTIDATIVGNKGSLTVDGGGGNDTITVTSPVTTVGAHFINGGTGNDTITGSDDTDRIAGDDGEDTIIASGSGNDIYAGGALGGTGDLAADTFVFDTAMLNSYFVQIDDFESAFDILQFSGLTDTGAAGLADDIDALGTLIDTGAGNTVQFAFDGGGLINFVGVGTGSVSSIADLVNDDALQLIA